jgi:hypothetical protein
MIRFVVCFLLLFVMFNAASAQEIGNAKTLADIFKPGTKVAVLEPRDADYFNVTIITSAQFYEIAKDSRLLDLAKLSAKYPKVDQLVREKQKELAAYIDDNRDDLEPGTVFGDPKMSFRRPSGDLGIVEHVGNDFIVVAFDENDQRRRLYSTRFIRTIEWHAGELEIFGSVPRYNRPFYDRQKAEQ